MLLQESTREMTNELTNCIAVDVDRERRMHLNQRSWYKHVLMSLLTWSDMDIDSSKKVTRFRTTEDISTVPSLRWNASQSIKWTRLGVAHHLNSNFVRLSISKRMRLLISAVNGVKSRGPRTDPCGTSQITFLRRGGFTVHADRLCQIP